MNKHFTATAAILEDLFDASSDKFNTDRAWEVVNALNTEQKVVPTTVSFTNTLLQFEPEGRSGKLPPFVEIGVNEIQHFYQFARYDNCVVIAIHGREKPPHYQALAFEDSQTAINFCECLRLVMPGNQMPKPLRKRPVKTLPANNKVSDKKDLGYDEQVERSEQLYAEAAWFLENGYPVASRKIQPKHIPSQQETDGGISKLAKKSAALLSSRQLQPNFIDNESPDFAAMLRARRERTKASREPVPRSVCALCASELQPELCEHCAHRVIVDRPQRLVKSRNKSMQRREFSTRMFQQSPENTKTLRIQQLNGVNSQNYPRLQAQRAVQRSKSTRNGQSYLPTSVEEVPPATFSTRSQSARRVGTHRAYSRDATYSNRRAERQHQMSTGCVGTQDMAYSDYTRGRSYQRHRSQERRRKEDGHVLYIWKGDRQEPVWRYSSEESFTSSSNSNEFRRYRIQQRPM
ncbi:hypothetical protein SprV_0100196300 [Sparganum proliferum]